MSDRDWKLRIEDILEAIAEIERYTAEMGFETFTIDERTIDAVVRNFTIIGEASRKIPPEIEARYRDLPWREMRGMRNIVVHEYFGVSLSILWQTLKQNLLPVLPMLKEMMECES